MVILTHIVVAFIAYFVACHFWAGIKRRAYISHAIQDVGLLHKLITRGALNSAGQTDFLSQAEPSALYPLKIQVLSQADRSATNKIMFRAALILVATAIGSYLITPFALVTFAVFVALAAFGFLPQAVKNSAHLQAVQLAVIIERWRRDDAVGCESFFTEAVALKPLHNAVKEIS